MKKYFLRFVSQLIDFAFLSLLITDIFISFYYYFLNFLIRYFPQMPNYNFLIREDNASVLPEYDISLYLVTLGLLVFILWIYTKLNQIYFFRKLHVNNIFKGAKLILIIPLGLFFINKLGAYPMSKGQQTNNDLFFPYLFVTALLITLFSGLFLILKRNRRLIIVFMIMIILVIAFFIFTAKFPIYYMDYSYLSGPIMEIANGKTIFNQIGSQYSFLFVLLLGYLMKFSLFDIVYLPVIVWFLYIIQYFLCFYLVLKLSDSIILAIISLFSLLTINYFSLMHIGTTIPQIGPLRWLPLVLSLYFLYRFRSLQSKKFILSLALLSFFIVDSGLYLIMVYGLTLLVTFLKQKTTLTQLLKSIGLLVTGLVGIYLVINLVNLSLGYQFINILLAFSKIRQYAQLGFGMIPIPSESYIWLIVATYILSLVYYFKQVEVNRFDNLLLYSANLSAFSLIYYVGRSHPHNLFHVSLFFILNISIFMSVIIKKKLINWLKPVVLLTFYLLFIITPAYARGQAITENIRQQIKRLSMKDIFVPEMGLMLAKYNDEAKLINDYIPQKEATIIFFEDTYLFYLTKKKNLMNMNPQIMIRTQEESDFSLAPVYKACPKRIAICKPLGLCGSPQDSEAQYLIQRLSLIENKCHTKYYPIACTDQLCIGEARKI